MISGIRAHQTQRHAVARRNDPMNIEAEVDRHLERMIQGIVEQLMEGQEGLSVGEARMDALVMLTVTIQTQMEAGSEEGDLFLLWLLEEKQKREMS